MIVFLVIGGLGFIAGLLSYRALALVLRNRRTYLKHFYNKKRPVTEIHVEEVETDETFSKLKEYCRQNPSAMLMLEVKNWKKGETILDRYRQLKLLGNPIGLHVHLALEPELPRLSFKKQFKLIDNGKNVLEKELEVTIRDFTAGWWSFNEDTVIVLKKLGIERVHVYYIQSRQAEIIRQHGLIPVKVKRYLHDWSLK